MDEAFLIQVRIEKNKLFIEDIKDSYGCISCGNNMGSMILLTEEFQRADHKLDYTKDRVWLEKYINEHCSIYCTTCCSWWPYMVVI